MGPLFSSPQAENILEIAKKYKSLYGQDGSLEYGSNYISPVVVELDPSDSSFLKESLFGPIVGISYFDGDEWKRWLRENPINLTDAVFSKDKKFIEEFLATSKSPRKVVNLDPTLESVFEPWGAFLPSGYNDVSYWFYKYRKCYQVVKKEG
jgi:acyl-CoA reductase-like NAD-dependent aldehyde dehydrogenase